MRADDTPRPRPRASTAQGVADALAKTYPPQPQPTGDALATNYPPDLAADATVDRLINRLRELPWPLPAEEIES